MRRLTWTFKMDTYFAPAKRTERRKFRNQITAITHNPIMDTLLKTAAGLLVVLNEDRQIVAVNHIFLDELGIGDIEQVLGFRLGESLQCVHAHERPSGCGTTQHCRSCGAAIAMMTAIDQNRTDEQVCALLTDKKGIIEDTCLLIKAIPISLEGNRWILIYAEDITQQHFWSNLERIFFHDLSNTLSAVSGNAQLLEMELPDNEEVKNILAGIDRLTREIQIQRTFSQRKQAGFKISKTTFTLEDIRNEIRLIITGHNSSHGKEIVENWPQENIEFNTDLLLVSRVLSNMLINAFEASKQGDPITLDAQRDGSSFKWEIWNKAYIPPEIQDRIFQRHFTTKSKFGRGLGTYSMKFFGEKHLGGKVFFNTSEKEGTVFTFRLPLKPPGN